MCFFIVGWMGGVVVVFCCCFWCGVCFVCVCVGCGYGKC